MGSAGGHTQQTRSTRLRPIVRTSIAATSCRSRSFPSGVPFNCASLRPGTISRQECIGLPVTNSPLHFRRKLGAIAQLGERQRGTLEVAGSSPAGSIRENPRGDVRTLERGLSCRAVVLGPRHHHYLRGTLGCAQCGTTACRSSAVSPIALEMKTRCASSHSRARSASRRRAAAAWSITRGTLSACALELG